MNAKTAESFDLEALFIYLADGEAQANEIFKRMEFQTNGIADLMILKTLDIKGIEIVKLFEDCCQENTDKLHRTLLMLWSKVYSDDQIKENLSLAKPIQFVDDNVCIQGIPSYSESFDASFSPYNMDWIEYCQINANLFETRLTNAVQSQVRVR